MMGEMGLHPRRLDPCPGSRRIRSEALVKPTVMNQVKIYAMLSFDRVTDRYPLFCRRDLSFQFDIVLLVGSIGEKQTL